MSKAHLGQVLWELLGQLQVGQGPAPSRVARRSSATSRGGPRRWTSAWTAGHLRSSSPSTARRPRNVRAALRSPTPCPGGTSVANAKGSALSMRRSSAVTISYLYRAPGSAPGMNSSQTPELPSALIGFRRPSQEFQSPTTRTALALGAQTAKAVPVTPWCVRGWAPSTSHSRRWRPSLNRCRSRSPSVGHNR